MDTGNYTCRIGDNAFDFPRGRVKVHVVDGNSNIFLLIPFVLDIFISIFTKPLFKWKISIHFQVTFMPLCMEKLLPSGKCSNQSLLFHYFFVLEFNSYTEEIKKICILFLTTSEHF